ncbi:MAG: AAA family ATPase [Candidatus Bathyarchaeota archaeon]|nr:MAG: AAA family ATPase [Candidatus Bathyarchaeota archaeon]
MEPSGIPGLDEIVGGGLVKGNCILLHGGPGSGKTTLAMQYLYNGAVMNDEPGVFITLCENPEEIRKNMLAFGWNLKKIEADKKLKIIDARPVTFNEQGYIVPNNELYKNEKVPFSHISRLIVRTMREMRAKRLAIDSITVLTSQYNNPTYIRQGLLGLIQVLSSLNCTTLLLAENRGDDKETNLERALVQGVILMHYARKGSAMLRAIQVLKLRGRKHSSDIYLMEISNKGIIIHPQERLEI